MLLDPDAAPLRDRMVVRERLDARIGLGSGMSVDDVWDALDPVERVEWMLGELLVCVRDNAHHIWIQHFALPERSATDWPARYDVIAEAGRALDPELADLLRWTSARAACVRAGGEEPMSGVVPAAWAAAWEGVPAWARGIVERWPEGLDPVGSAPAWHRAAVPPAVQEPFFPGARVHWEEGMATSPTDLVDRASLALWRAGADDETLNAAYEDLAVYPDALPEALARWVVLGDGDPALLEPLRRALDPVARVLGIETTRETYVVFVPREELPRIETQLECDRLRASPEATLMERARRATRMGVGALLVDAEDVRNDDLDGMFQLAACGVLWVLGGSTPVTDAWVAQLRSAGLNVARR